MGLDTPARLVESLGHQVIEITVEDDPVRIAHALEGAHVGNGAPLVLANTVSMTVNGRSSDVDELLGRLRDGVDEAAAMTVRKTTLNDVFLHLTARTEPAVHSNVGG